MSTLSGAIAPQRSTAGTISGLSQQQPPETEERLGQPTGAAPAPEARVPERPALDGLEVKWSSAWERDGT